MKKHVKLSWLALITLLGCAGFFWSVIYAQEAPAEKMFKNIKALKGVPASQVGGLMDSYNRALGVSCEYCHVAGDLPNGTKPEHQKSVRDIQMTREINEKYKHAVDCMSCHQGKAKPTTTGVASSSAASHATSTTSTTGSTATTGTSGTTATTGTTATSTTVTPPDLITFPATFGASKKVAFPHHKHLQVGCDKCHHTGEMGKCISCHAQGRKTGSPSGFHWVAHEPSGGGPKSERNCSTCHKQMNVSRIVAKSCAGCHN